MEEKVFKNRTLIILGLPRSGTTLLAELFGRLDSVALENEPNPIWRFLNYSRLGHEEFSKAQATKEVSRHIRAYFEKKLNKASTTLLVEKTPANTLRIDFVRAVLPEARIIVITRSSRDIVDSIVRRVELGEDRNATKLEDQKLFRNLRLRANKLRLVHPRDFPAYFRTLLFFASGGMLARTEAFWGPRFRGWQQSMQDSAVHRAIRQVEIMESKLHEFLSKKPTGTLVIRYENLVGDPDSVLADIERFVGLKQGALDRTLIKS